MNDIKKEDYIIEEVTSEITKYKVIFDDRVIETFDNPYNVESFIEQDIKDTKRRRFLKKVMFDILEEAYTVNNKEFDHDIKTNIQFEIHNLNNDKRGNNLTAYFKSRKDDNFYEFDENFYIDDKSWDTFCELMMIRYGFEPSIPYYYWPK